MKTRILSLAAASVAVAVLASSSVYAVDDTFTGAVDTSFSNAANYTNNQLAIGTNRQVFNLATAGNAGLSVTVPVNNTAPTNIAFDTNAGNYAFTGSQFLFQSNGGVLFNLLSTLNGTPTITVANNIQDFNARTTNATLTLQNSKAGASLILNGNITGGATTGQTVGVAVKEVAGAVVTLNGVLADGISGGNLLLGRTGGGGATILNINGVNTYTGGTEFSGGSGTIVLGNKSALGTGALRLLDANSTLQSATGLTGANAVANAVNYVSNTFAATPTTTTLQLTFTSGSNTAAIVSGVAPAVGDFVRAGNSTFLPIYARVTGVTGSTVTFDVNAIGSGSTTTALTTTPYATSGAGTLAFAGTSDLELSGTQNLTTVFSNLTAATQTFNVTNTGLTTFSGTLQQQGGVASIAKTGVGRLVLSGANTYTGTTTVTAGTLFANNASGSATGTGAVSVAVTLGGTGSVGGPVSVTATGSIAPGFAAIGTLGVGSATFATGGKLLIEYDVANGIDKLADAGTLDITNANVTFTNLAAGPLTAASYVIATYASLVGSQFATVTGLPTGYTLNYGTGTNGTISLISAVQAPEPAALGVVAAASSMLLRRRRSAK